MRISHPDRWLLAAAIALPTASAGGLIALRSQLDNTNVAMLLVIAVVAVAAGGSRVAAAVAAVTAAAGFNFFHTEPYHSLRIHSAADVRTDVCLLVVGLAVGELAARGRRQKATAAVGRAHLATIHSISTLAASGEPIDYVLMATAAALTTLLDLDDCEFRRDQAGEVLPIVHADGGITWGPTAWPVTVWGLPTSGALLPVTAGGRTFGHFLLRSPVGKAIAADRLRLAVTLADQAGSALASGASAA